MNTEAPIINEDRFHRMACGDLDSFYELAGDYFEDAKARLDEWRALHQAEENKKLREEFHRCKGGAAIFGFERLHSLLTAWEKRIEAGEGGVDLDLLVSELANAEREIVRMQG